MIGRCAISIVDTINRVFLGDRSAEAELYSIIHKCALRNLLMAGMPIDAAWDEAAEVWMLVLEAVRSSALVNPAKVESYAYIVCRRRTYRYFGRLTLERRGRHIDHMGRSLPNGHSEAEHNENPMVDHWALSVDQPSPEDAAMDGEIRGLALRILDGMPALYRELIKRFYFMEQSAAEIQADLGITVSTFNDRKKIAKSRFVRLMREAVSKRRKKA